MVPPAELGRWFPLIQDFIGKVQRAWWLAGSPELYLTSWWRSIEYNRDVVGGDPWSQHLVGLAIDVDGADRDLADFAEACRMVDLHPVPSGGYLHVQRMPAGYLERLFG